MVGLPGRMNRAQSAPLLFSLALGVTLTVGAVLAAPAARAGEVHPHPSSYGVAVGRH